MALKRKSYSADYKLQVLQYGAENSNGAAERKCADSDKHRQLKLSESWSGVEKEEAHCPPPELAGLFRTNTEEDFIWFGEFLEWHRWFSELVGMFCVWITATFAYQTHSQFFTQPVLYSIYIILLSRHVSSWCWSLANTFPYKRLQCDLNMFFSSLLCIFWLVRLKIRKIP